MTVKTSPKTHFGFVVVLVVLVANVQSNAPCMPDIIQNCQEKIKIFFQFEVQVDKWSKAQMQLWKKDIKKTDKQSDGWTDTPRRWL